MTISVSKAISKYLFKFRMFLIIYFILLIFRNQELCASTKVFIASNFINEQFLCYLLPTKNQLICVELQHPETNINDILLGNVTALIAKDAAYLPVII